MTASFVDLHRAYGHAHAAICALHRAAETDPPAPVREALQRALDTAYAALDELDAADAALTAKMGLGG